MMLSKVGAFGSVFVLIVVAVVGWVAVSRNRSAAAAGTITLQQSGAGRQDACKLLAAQELSTGLRSSYSGAVPSRNGEDEIACDYPAGPGNMYPATLTITLKNGKAVMATLRGIGTNLVPGTKAQNNVGDASFYMPLDVGIYALKGDVLVSLQFGLAKGTREQKQALMQKVLSRL